MDERPIRSVPRPVLILLSAAFVVQILLGALQRPPQARADQLSDPPASSALHIFSLGDPIALAQALTLYLQAFDNQPGISIPFAQLDYTRVERWLERLVELDPQAQYPLMMAAQLYAQVPDEAKQRAMLDFVHRHFLQDPNRRWRWLAHAAIMAKHRLNDLPLALQYAETLAQYATGVDVPGWAKQMRIFLYADMGEYEVARVLLGGLLDSGQVNDPHELHFLIEQLERLKSAEKSSSASEN